MTQRRKRKRKRRHTDTPEVGAHQESSESEHSASQKSRHSDEASCSSQVTAEAQSIPEKDTDEPSSSSIQDVSKESTQLQEAQSHGSPPSLIHPDLILWQKRIKEWYPYYRKQTYYVPSVFMNRMQLSETEAAGQNVLQIDPPVTEPHVTGAVYDKDAREDRAHQKILDCLQLLKEEVMFVISQLQFGNYLGEPTYAAAAKTLPRPIDLLLERQNKHQGDFDILIIHKDFGILACEIKSVGENFSDPTLKVTLDKKKILVTKVEEAISQLEKSYKVLDHIVPTYGYDKVRPRIKTTLMLPNIRKDELEKALSSNQKAKELCKRLGLNNTEDPIPLCLTEDDLQNPTNWWNCIMTREGKDPVLKSSDNMYLELISRFCGPATTITVHCPSNPRLAIGTRSIRSPGNGVAETARRFAPAYCIMLHPTQVDFLNKKDEPLVYIAGPPGTGKTVVLLVKAREWLKEQKTVLLVSTQLAGFGVSHMLKEQLGQSQGKVQILSFDLKEGYKKALLELENRARVENGELYIIADEVFTGSAFWDLCRDLKEAVQGLHFWAASLYHRKAPEGFTKFVLTEPLRSPPKVIREIEGSGFVTYGDVKSYTKPHGNAKGSKDPEKDVKTCTYTTPGGPLPTDGPAVISLLHQGQGHGHGTTYDCVQCGKDIAKKLMELDVGQTASTEDPWSYQDVFILTEKQDLVDMGTDTRGLLLGLYESNIPYRVVREGDIKDIKEVATKSGPNKVVVTQSMIVSGLERPVVVFVQGDQTSQDEHNGRLQAMSRTIAQLIWVRCPP